MTTPPSEAVETAGSRPLWHRFDRLESTLCVSVNRGCRNHSVRAFFAAVSRLGDGAVWHSLMLALAVGGEGGARVAAQMAATGLVGLALYKQLKRRLVRERPYLMHAGIELGTTPLDRYSFPSGHTLHAVCFTTLVTAHVPELAVILVPFTGLVAVSRVVLGLHYPTDVAAGAAIGALLAGASLAAWPA